jgi:hypothetical protein
MNISDAQLMLRRYRWELFVNAFVDIMQISFQVIVFTTTSTYFWIFLIPHVFSNVFVFGFFSASGDSARATTATRTATISQIAESITLLSDSFLTLLIVYAIIECAAYGNVTFRSSLVFNAKLCQGPRYDGGFLQAVELVFSLGSIFLQANQLTTLEKVAKIQSPGSKGGITAVVISIALSFYTLSYLAYRAKYLLLFIDLFILATSGVAMFLQFMLPSMLLSRNEKALRILETVLYSLGWFTGLAMIAYLIADSTALCQPGSNTSTTCSFTDTVSIVIFCIFVFVRIITQLIFRFNATQEAAVAKMVGWKRK